jgi:hypothetical protein
LFGIAQEVKALIDSQIGDLASADSIRAAIGAAFENQTGIAFNPRSTKPLRHRRVAVLTARRKSRMPAAACPPVSRDIQ